MRTFPPWPVKQTSHLWSKPGLPCCHAKPLGCPSQRTTEAVPGFPWRQSLPPRWISSLKIVILSLFPRATAQTPPCLSLGMGAQLGQREEQERDGNTTGMGYASFPWALTVPKENTSCTRTDYALCDMELKLLTKINQIHQ